MIKLHILYLAVTDLFFCLKHAHGEYGLRLRLAVEQINWIVFRHSGTLTLYLDAVALSLSIVTWLNSVGGTLKLLVV